MVKCASLADNTLVTLISTATTRKYVKIEFATFVLKIKARPSITDIAHSVVKPNFFKTWISQIQSPTQRNFKIMRKWLTLRKKVGKEF